MKKVLLTLSFLMFLGVSVIYAQTVNITGTVTGSDDGMPIPGASVFVEGTTVGTVTQADGSYSLNVPENAESLVFTFVGMRSHTETIEGRTTIDVTLDSDAIAMDEVIVVAYGTSTRASFTGSASNVQTDEILSSRAESVDKALAGRISGVRSTSTTGDPGSAGEMQIRGIGSITGSTSPLYVVDGVPITTGDFGLRASSNVLSTLNPDDIESMTVLKDAAAASLYGSRAANGVVIITTKQGSEGETQFNFRANIGWSDMATNSFELMSGPEYAQYHQHALEGYFLYQEDALVPGGANYGNEAIIDAARDFAEANRFEAGWLSPSSANEGSDWRDYIYDGGSDQEYQFSASGGNENTTFYTSLGYRNVEGIVRNREFERFTGVLNLENQARDWITFGVKTQLAYTNQLGRGDQTDQEQGISTGSPLSLLFAADPTQMAYDEDGGYNMSGSFNTTVGSPIGALSKEEAFIENKTYRALNNLTATIQILPELSFRTTNAVDYTLVKHFNYWGPNSMDGASINGLGERQNQDITSLTTSNVFNYVNAFDGVHNVDALIGFESQKYENTYEFMSASDYSNELLRELANAQPRNVSSAFYKRYMQSFFANANYNYDNRYYLGASLRSDESSRLGSDNRRGTFYSFSGSWRFSEEEFFGSNFVSDGRVRASYGTNGNLPGSSYAHLGLYYLGSEYGGLPAIFLDQAENADLGWEMSKNFNLGFDFTFVDRFTLSAEYYNKYTTDLLLDVPSSYFTGVEESLQNFGEISNTGVDIELRGYDLLLSEVQWDASLMFSTLDAKVEELPQGEDIIMGDGNLYIYSEGEDLYSFYLPTYHGVDPESGLAQFLIDPDGSTDESNLTYDYNQAMRGNQGAAYPNITGGLSNTFSWNGFSLDMLLTYQFGGQLFDYPGYFTRHDGARNATFNLAKDVAGNYWTQPGDIVDNPRPVVVNPLRPDLWSSRHLYSTDFVRLKELTFNYDLPARFYEQIGVDAVRLSFSAHNLPFLYAATDDMELEVALNGYRTVDTPLARTFSFGVNVQF
ncbi:SusC/RagA family TonB-linked outer membrane protein [Marinilabiliaceae bacterium ANBcel2]|nr:SusC/RagA family TonB-linked outer membrane protein [Marinilabiliaceae bacterium ANBcel2]